MPFLTWSDKYSIGIDTLDDEHRELFDDLNALHESVIQSDEPARIGCLIHQLSDHTRAHFASEEVMMAQNKFAGLSLHRLKHDHLIDQIKAFCARFDRGGFTLDGHSLKFLADWLTTHIANEDLVVGRWLNEHRKS